MRPLEVEAAGALLGRVEASLAELARARERLQSSLDRVRAEDAHSRTLAVLEDRLAALGEEERSMRQLHARLLCEQVDDQLEQAQMRADAVQAQASVLLGLDDEPFAS